MKDRLERFVKLWIDLFDRHALLDHASAVAFQVLKSLIPLTLLGLAILGATGQQHLWARDDRAGDEAAPAAADLPRDRLRRGEDFSTDSAGLIMFASLLALWYISGSVRAFMGGINQIYSVDDERSWPVRYAISTGLAACIAVGVIGSLLFTIWAGRVGGDGALQAVTQAGRWLVAIVLLGVVLGLLVRFAPAKHRAKRWTSVGSALVIIAWLAATLIFELFVVHVANFKTATGELTVFLVLIGYVYTSSIILLVGVELDDREFDRSRLSEPSPGRSPASAATGGGSDRFRPAVCRCGCSG